MAAKCLFGRPYYLYPNSVGHLFLDTFFAWCLMVVTLFWRTHFLTSRIEILDKQSVVSTDARHNACSHTSIAWKCHQHFAFWPQVNASLEKITWFSLHRNVTDTLALQTQKRTPTAQHGSDNLSARSRLKTTPWFSHSLS